MDERRPDGDAVDRLRDEYWRGLADEPEAAVAVVADQHLVFRVGGRLFAFETRYCRQVLRVPRVVPLPAVPTFLRGIVNLRGRVLSVTDLGLLLGVAPASALDGRLIVVGDERRSTAMAVDRVDRILDVPRDQVQRPGSGGPGGATASGEVLLSDGLVVLLSVPALLALPELQIEWRRDEE